MKKYASPAMEYMPMFLRHIIAAFLVRTEPASSIVKPAHIHITSAPQMRNANVLKTKAVSPSTAACATDGRRKNAVSSARLIAAAMTRGRRVRMAVSRINIRPFSSVL